MFSQYSWEYQVCCPLIIQLTHYLHANSAWGGPEMISFTNISGYVIRFFTSFTSDEETKETANCVILFLLSSTGNEHNTLETAKTSLHRDI